MQGARKEASSMAQSWRDHYWMVEDYFQLDTSASQLLGAEVNGLQNQPRRELAHAGRQIRKDPSE